VAIRAPEGNASSNRRNVTMLRTIETACANQESLILSQCRAPAGTTPGNLTFSHYNRTANLASGNLALSQFFSLQQSARTILTLSQCFVCYDLAGEILTLSQCLPVTPVTCVTREDPLTFSQCFGHAPRSVSRPRRKPRPLTLTDRSTFNLQPPEDVNDFSTTR